MSIKKALPSLSYITIGIIFGKLTGFLKHFLIIKYFGLTYKSDVFFIANTITEMAINIVLAGLLTGAFIPVASEVFIKFDEKRFSEFVSSAFIIIGGIVMFASILLYIFSYQLGKIMAPGYSFDQYLILSKIFKLLSPGILFIGLAAMQRGIMHTLESFLVPAFGLFIANGATIISTIIFYNKIGIYAPAIGVSGGFLLWFLMQLPFTVKYLHFKHLSKIFDRFIKKLFRLCIPAILVILLTNIILIIEKAVASTFIEGSVSQLNLAFRIVHVFSSILAIPLATIILPKMSKYFGNNDLHNLFLLSKRSIKIVSVVIFIFLSFIILNDKLIIHLSLTLLNISLFYINLISSFLTIYAFAIAVLFLYIIIQRIIYSTQKIIHLVLANFFGVISYIVVIVILKKPLGIYVLPLAYFFYALTVVCYLMFIIKKNILFAYPSLIDKKIFIYGLITIIVSLSLRFYAFNNTFILLIFSIVIVILYLWMIERNRLLKIGNILRKKKG